MAIISGHQGNRKCSTHFQQCLVDGFLGLNTIFLDLQIEIALTKHGLVGSRNLGSLIQTTGFYQTWNLTVEATTQGYQALTAIGKYCFVNPGLVIEALQGSCSNQPTKILVSFLVFNQRY